MFKFYSFFVILCLIQLCLSAPTTESDSTPGSTTSATENIEASLLHHSKTIVSALESTDGVLKNLEIDNLPSEERATAVRNALVAHYDATNEALKSYLEATQAAARAFLAERNVQFSSFVANNSKIVEDANVFLVQATAQSQQVQRISAESTSTKLS